MCLLIGGNAEAAPYNLKIRVAHATTGDMHVDNSVKDLAKQLAEAKLKFTSVRLKDEATMPIELGAHGRMQLPNSEWMEVHALGVVKGKNLRLRIDVKKLKFSTTVVVEPGATVAVRGPDFKGGALVLAITRQGG